VTISARKNNAEELARFRQQANYWKSQHKRAVQRIGQIEKKHSKQLSAFRKKLSIANEKIKKLRVKIAELWVLVKLRTKQAFGKKSERRRTSKKKDESKGEKKPHKGHPRRDFSKIEIKEELNDLPEEKKCCSQCGKPRYELDPNISDTIEVEVKAHIRRIKSPQYAKTCQCPGEPKIIGAPVCNKLIPYNNIGISAWVLIVMDKYFFQRPTYRLLAELNTYGISLARSTLTEGLHRLAPLFKPIVAEILARVRAATYRKADETRWPVFIEVDGKIGHNWYIWVFLCHDAVYFKLAKTRSSLVVEEVLGEEVNGVLLVDRYSAYKAYVVRCGGNLLLAFCWAHVRRDFLQIEMTLPALASWAHEWVNRIDHLWALNDLRREALNAGRDDLQEKANLEKQLELMKKCFSDQLISPILPPKAILHPKPESGTPSESEPSMPPERNKALNSLKNHWEGLTLFFKFPEIPMDNNEAERVQRNHVIGRKNYYGSRAEWAGELSADLFSIFQTLERNGINPKLWLTDYLEACAKNGGKAPENVADYLPWNLSNERRQALALKSSPNNHESNQLDATGPPILQPNLQHRGDCLDLRVDSEKNIQPRPALAANM
jgi:transposase